MACWSTANCWFSRSRRLASRCDTRSDSSEDKDSRLMSTLTCPATSGSRLLTVVCSDSMARSRLDQGPQAPQHLAQGRGQTRRERLQLRQAGLPGLVVVDTQLALQLAPESTVHQISNASPIVVMVMVWLCNWQGPASPAGQISPLE